MQASNFNLSDYLLRIGFTGQPQADLPTLRALMRCQLRSIPFENLDVLAGRGVSLVPEDIVRKLVHHRRGGYCYEVNGLFAMALAALGLPYRMVAARPMFYPVRRPRTHMALLVTVDGEEWLVDLGFGSYGIRAPMRLADTDVDVPQDDDLFSLTQPQPGEWVLRAWRDGAWAPQYGFDLWPQEWVDFAPANHLNSTHPDAIFVQKRLLVIHTDTGRTIWLGDTLAHVIRKVSHSQTVAEADIPRLLQQEFGLVV